MKTLEEKAKAYDEALERARKLYNSEETSADVEIACENIFPELAESEDERIEKEIIAFLKENLETGRADETWSLSGLKRWIAWLEKQATKSVNIDIESMVSQYKQRLKSQGGVENTPIVNMCLTAFRHGVENVLEELNLKKLEKQVEKKPASSAKPCKNDTIYDLLQKMPPFITVDGVDYYFVIKKTSFYTAYYKAIGEEGSGNAIFWATAFSPIDLLNAMLEKLKKEGLLELTL